MTTSSPARAHTSAMPEPMSPHPTTPTRSITMGAVSHSPRRTGFEPPTSNRLESVRPSLRVAPPGRASAGTLADHLDRVGRGRRRSRPGCARTATRSNVTLARHEPFAEACLPGSPRASASDGPSLIWIEMTRSAPTGRELLPVARAPEVVPRVDAQAGVRSVAAPSMISIAVADVGHVRRREELDRRTQTVARGLVADPRELVSGRAHVAHGGAEHVHVARPEHVGHAPHDVLVAPRPVESQRFDLVDDEPRARRSPRVGRLSTRPRASRRYSPAARPMAANPASAADADTLVELDVTQAVLAEDRGRPGPGLRSTGTSMWRPKTSARVVMISPRVA